MFKNYFKIAYRNLLKNKTSSVVNMFGLSVAIGVTIVVFLFMERQFTMDRFHEQGENIFLIENVIARDGSQQLWGDSPGPLGPIIEADFPQIERAVRVGDGGGTFQVNETVLRESIRYVDEGFLDMFTFPLKYGDKTALADEDAIILSERLAIKYFGDTNPLGQQITITFDNDFVEAFTVRGVAERFPPTASFRFNALINFDKQRDLDVDLDDWARFTGATFIQLRNPDDLGMIAGQMDKYLALQNAATEDWPIAEFRFDNLYQLSIHSENVRRDISGGADMAGVIVLSLIALFLMALSCFNYMNIAVYNGFC